MNLLIEIAILKNFVNFKENRHCSLTLWCRKSALSQVLYSKCGDIFPENNSVEHLQISFSRSSVAEGHLEAS